MDPKDEAIVAACMALSSLHQYRSRWVKEICKKALQRIDTLVDTVPLYSEYEEVWKARGK